GGGQPGRAVERVLGAAGATDHVRPLQHLHREPGAGQHRRGDQPVVPGPDDDDIRLRPLLGQDARRTRRASGPRHSPLALRALGLAHRSATRRTNLRPDQVESTAATLTSTSPAASPCARTTFSSRSVATPLLRFGQATQSAPAVVSRGSCAANRRRSAARSGQNASTTSYGCPRSGRDRTTAPAGAARSNPAGAPTSSTRQPSLTPSLAASGLPE